MKKELVEQQINQMIEVLDDKGNISDGSHTFTELYYHRMILFSILCNNNPEKSWKSWEHSDGTMFEDYFIVGIATKEGQYTYHYHRDAWEDFKVKEIPNAPEWDGHEAKDIGRLLNL